MKVIKGTHLAISPFTPDTLISMWIDSLMHSAIGIDITADALEFTRRDVHEGKLRFPGLACILCGATTPTADPNRWTVYRTKGTYPHDPSNFRCELGEHSFTLADLIDHHCPTKPKLRALLKKIGSHEPQLRRFYVAEIDGRRAVNTDAQDAVREILPVVNNCLAKIVGIDSPTKEIAAQLAGQCDADLPWHEEVELHKDGSLVLIDWHKGRLTDLERLRMENRETAARFKNIKRVEEETAAFRFQRRAELGL
jgi:hypothetical protein